MKDNRIELADVIHRFKDAYVDEFGHLMMPSQKKALADIAGGSAFIEFLARRPTWKRPWPIRRSRKRSTPLSSSDTTELIAI